MNFQNQDLSEFGTQLEGVLAVVQAVTPQDYISPPSQEPSAPDPLASIKPENWSMVQPNTYTCVPATTRQLPAGLYQVIPSRHSSILFERMNSHVDELLKFPDTMLQGVLDDIATFWTKGAAFRHHGFLHRRGYLFFGPQGSGKTSLVQQIISQAVHDSDIVLYCTKPLLLQMGLAMFRAVEPKRRIVCVFEDIDAIIKECGDDCLLSLLDGENQIDEVLNIATTNYPELLDKRLVNRPRRFDRVIKIGWPSAVIRRMYFARKLKVQDSELDRWVAASDKLSFAAMAELVISVECLGHDFDTTVKLLLAQNQAKPSSAEFDCGEGPKGFAQR